MEKIKWGILSTANIGRKAMIPALKASEMAEVTAVASRSSLRARRFAKDLDIPQAYGSYEALLKDPAIDAVYIPLPNHLHKGWTIKAAQAGKHVLCEKPLALNAAECREMIAASQANNVRLMEAFMYRYHPRIFSALELIRSGKIGDVKSIESAFTFRVRDKKNIRFNSEMGGGALMDVGCYCVNFSRLLAGREPVAVQGRAAWASTGVDEQLSGLLDFGEGLMAQFVCAINMERRQHTLIAGTEGSLTLPDTFNPGIAESAIHQQKDGSDAGTLWFDPIDVYRLVAEDFMRSMTNSAPSFTIDDAVANMRVIEALLISAKSNGEPVELIDND